MSVCEEHRLRKKRVCEICRGLWCYEPAADCYLKQNHIENEIQCRSICAAKIYENNGTSDASESENN